MNKRSAMTIAAGLVAALLAGVAAFSLSLGSSATPASASSKAHRKPIVRTIERTVTVERKAKGGASGAQVVTLQAPSSTDSSFDGDDGFEGDDDAFEHEFEGEDHDGFEEEHESEDHDSEDHPESDDGDSSEGSEGDDD